MADMMYEIVSKFEFKVEEALEKSDMLRNAVDKISSAADGVMERLTAIPRFLMGDMGINLSVGAIFAGAISSVEKFNSTQLQFANIIGSNMEHLSGPIGTFNERMAVSRDIIHELVDTARDFSIDESSFISTTKLLGAMLIPKGLAGENFGTAKEMSRGLLKSAPILGVDPGLVQNDLLRAIEGGASMVDTVFRRLASETKAFQNLRTEGLASGKMKATDPLTKLFNSLPAPERVRILTAALTQFGDDANVVAGNANLLSNQFTRIKNQLYGLRGVLQEIGEVVVPPLKIILTHVSEIIEKYLRPFMEKLGVALKAIIDNPERFLATLQQLRMLREDLDLGAKLAGFAATLMNWVSIGTFLASLAPLTGKGAAALARFLTAIGLTSLIPGATFVTTKLGAFFAAFNPMKILQGIFSGLWKGVVLFFSNFAFFAKVVTTVARVALSAFKTFIAPLAFFTTILQIMSRANAYATMIDTKAVVDPEAGVAKAVGSFVVAVKQLWQPIDDVIDQFAQLLAILFAYDTYVSPLVSLFDVLGKVLGAVRWWLVVFLGGWQGFFFLFFQFALNTWEAIVNIWKGLEVAIAQILSVVSSIVLNFFEGLRAGFTYIAKFVGSIWENISNGSYKNLFGRATEAAEKGHKLAEPVPFDFLLGKGEKFSDGMALPKIDLGKGLTDAFLGGANDVFDRYYKDGKAIGGKEKAEEEKKKTIVNSGTTINGGVTIKNEFREQMEPDRIANSLVKTLMSVAENPRQAAGQSMNAGFFR